jgi:hypothetical protein
MSNKTDSGIKSLQICTKSHVRVKITVLSADPTDNNVYIVNDTVEDIPLGDTRTFSIGVTNSDSTVGFTGTGVPDTYATLGWADTDGTKYKECNLAGKEDRIAYKETSLYRKYVTKVFEERRTVSTNTSTGERTPDTVDNQKKPPASAIGIKKEEEEEEGLVFEYQLTEEEKAAKKIRDQAFESKIEKRRARALAHGFDVDTHWELERDDVLQSLLRTRNKRKRTQETIDILSDDSEESVRRVPRRPSRNERIARSQAAFQKYLEENKKA